MATFLLAFDHRRSLMTSFFEAGDEPERGQVSTAREIKTVIADGLLAAIRRSRVDRRDAGGLVDALYGGIAIMLRVLREQLACVQVPGWVAGHDIGKGAAAIDPELPAFVRNDHART